MSGSTARRARVIGVAGVAAVAALLAGCSSSGSGGSGGSGGGGSSSGTGSSGGSYTWGLNDELSGPTSFYGTAIANGVTAYVNQVNAQGGINGKKINIVKLDNAGSASRAAANATQLITADKASAIFGNVLSSDCSGAQPIVERYQVPMACLSVDTPNPWVYNLGADNSRGASALFDAAKKVTGKSDPKLGLLYIDTLTDLALAKSAASEASSAGVTLATSQKVELTATDVSQQVAQLVAAKPDAVIMSETPPGFTSVLKGLRAAGLNVPVILIDGTGSLPLTTTDPNSYALSVYKLVDPATTDSFAKKYIAAVKTLPGESSATSTQLNSSETAVGYMTATAFGTALKACGSSCSGSQLQAELNKTDLNMGALADKFVYTSSDHYPYANWYLYKSQNSKDTLVDTIPTGSSS